MQFKLIRLSGSFCLGPGKRKENASGGLTTKGDHRNCQEGSVRLLKEFPQPRRRLVGFARVEAYSKILGVQCNPGSQHCMNYTERS
jgi:hypothetical protein